MKRKEDYLAISSTISEIKPRCLLPSQHYLIRINTLKELVEICEFRRDFHKLPININHFDLKHKNNTCERWIVELFRSRILLVTWDFNPSISAFSVSVIFIHASLSLIVTTVIWLPVHSNLITDNTGC